MSNKSANSVKEILSMHIDIAHLVIGALRSSTKKIVYGGEKIDDSFKDLIDATEGLNNFIPIDTRKDGNCFYNATVKLLLGDELFSHIVRFGITFILVNNEQLFFQLLRSSGSLWSLIRF
jgi:hypothetical protein